jgi:hypothetical protein
LSLDRRRRKIATTADVAGYAEGVSIRDERTMRPWHIPMTGRDTEEPHRASTPLELLFDLCFVRR